MRCHRIHALVKTRMSLIAARRLKGLSLPGHSARERGLAGMACNGKVGRRVAEARTGDRWVVAAGSLSSRTLSLQPLAQRHHCSDRLCHTGLLQLTGLVKFLTVRLAMGCSYPSCSRNDRNGGGPPPPPRRHHHHPGQHFFIFPSIP